MRIEFETPLSEDEKDFLRALIGDASAAPVQEPAPAKKATPAPAKKAETKPAPKPEPTPEPEEEPEPEVEEEVVEETTAAPTLSDAVKVATEMVAAGKAAKIKEALNSLGAKKVSDLKPNQIASFIGAIEG